MQISKERLEKQREKSRKALDEHKAREEMFSQHKEEGKKGKNKTRIMIAIFIIALAVIIAYALLSPGKYDDFAKCLTAKGAVMYGEDWCQYTNAQKGMFGKSFKYVDYHVKEGLKKRPTWIINGQTFETVQSFERLSALTGCKVEGGNTY